MLLPQLQIGNIKVPYPIIQGGMAIRISTATLAAAVARQGGIGVIAGTGMSPGELRNEIRLAKKLSHGRGAIGLNVLFAVANFPDLVKAGIEEGIDLVISGAGFSRDMFCWGKQANVPVVPIVSSARLAKTAEKLGASAVIVEGVEAGGHLGTNRSVTDILPEVKQAVQIPVIAAGGIISGQDIYRMMQLGADGVQMGTRFAASLESNACEEFKQAYLRAKAGDSILIESPVGLPGRGIPTIFSNRVAANGGVKPAKCTSCLKKCSKRFCIKEALENAQQGNLAKGVVFAGSNVHLIQEILPVEEIFRKLIKEFEITASGPKH